MAGLVTKIEEVAGSGIWVEAACRIVFQSGLPMVSAVSNDDGQLISDIYVLRFDLVNPALNARVTVTSTASPNNPNSGRQKTVSLDGSTEYVDVVRGLTLVFSDSGAFDDTWLAQLNVGYSFGAVAGFGADAGVPSSSRRLQVYNSGTDHAENCVVSLAEMAQLWQKTGSIFARVYPFAPGASEKLTSDSVAPYAVTVANVTGSGSGKTFDVLFDGATVEVTNLNTEAVQMSEALNVTDTYEVSDGDLLGLRFMLDQTCVTGDTANILIFDKRFLQIAEDISGAPGTWGTADVDLTEDGESTGVITAAGEAYYHIRVLAPDGGNSSSNPYVCNSKILAETAGPAGWTS